MDAKRFNAIVKTMMWASVGLAIAVAIICTEKVSALWFFLIPALAGLKIVEDDSNDKE